MKVAHVAARQLSLRIMMIHTVHVNRPCTGSTEKIKYYIYYTLYIYISVRVLSLLWAMKVESDGLIVATSRSFQL